MVKEMVQGGTFNLDRTGNIDRTPDVERELCILCDYEWLVTQMYYFPPLFPWRRGKYLCPYCKFKYGIELFNQDQQEVQWEPPKEVTKL